MTSGTKEWAEVNCNFQRGCRNNCAYCYAKSMAIRFKTATAESWKDPQIVMPKSYPHGKTVMFPSSHDIDEYNVEYAIECLKRLLENDNKVLIVTKAQERAIDRIVNALLNMGDPCIRAKVSFRITIGSRDNEILRIFEPHAPDFHERFTALKHLFYNAFPTSVSAEPLLGGRIEFYQLYSEVEGYVSDKIWIGKMNMPKQRIMMNTERVFSPVLLNWLMNEQTDDKMLALYGEYKDDPKVAFKDSIMNLVRKRG